MSVYVGVPMWPFGRMIMCHMVADSEEELDAMAAKLGMRRSWKQGNPERKRGTVGALVHYDVAKGKRAQAVALGAIPLDTIAEEAAVLERLADAERDAGPEPLQAQSDPDADFYDDLDPGNLG